MTAWDALDEEIARWRDAGRNVEFWWRDDDAAEPDAPLERLLTLAARSGMPLAVAAIPARLSSDAAAMIRNCAGAVVVQHGYAHANHAGPDRPKSEYPETRGLAERARDMSDGRKTLAALFAERFLPVFVPPWNRMAEDGMILLSASGLIGLSRHKPRRSATLAGGVRQSNVHVDIVDWQAGRGFLGEDRALGLIRGHLEARRAGSADPAEPTGILGHHRVQDAGAWDFLARLFERHRDRFCPAARVFA
jgi:hypothetical protein